jgi:ribosomal protein S18 acetylase RimI-like enzyme
MPQQPQASYRQATIEDLDHVCKLGNELNRLHHEAWSNIFAQESDPRRDESHWRQSLQGETAATFVAEVQGAIVGFVTVHVGNESSPLLQPVCFARIGSVCVVEQERGRGIGRALMDQAEKWAAANRATDMRLNVWKFNAAALHLYAELGYEVRSLSMGKPIQPRET